eukprot:scaffold96820_cov54-Attheya_sp.AAC.1
MLNQHLRYESERPSKPHSSMIRPKRQAAAVIPTETKAKVPAISSRSAPSTAKKSHKGHRISHDPDAPNRDIAKTKTRAKHHPMTRTRTRIIYNEANPSPPSQPDPSTARRPAKKKELFQWHKQGQ